MKWVIIVLIVVAAALLYVGYMVFAGVLDFKDGYQEIADESSKDTDSDLMRPTSRRLTEYQNQFLDNFYKHDFEELDIMSFDNLRLHGYLLKGNPKEVVICVHGYKSKPEFDYCDKIEMYKKRGCTCLFVCDRAHGKSEGRYIGFSELDKYDVAKWVDKINELYDNPNIYLHGVSMGGATVIHCADMKLKNVKGIIDDCGFNSIRGITQALFKISYGYPYFPVGYIAGMWSKLIAHIDFDASIGEKCVANTDVPILFIHGKQDHFVPCYMSENMYKVCNSPKELLIVEDAGHAACYMMAEEKYADAVNRLMNGEIK